MSDSDPQLMTVFANALERTDPADRVAYLDATCEGNSPLRRRVEALLTAHEGAGRFLELGAADTVEAAAPETPDRTADLASETTPGTELLTGEAGASGNVPTIADTPAADRPGGFVPGRVIAGRYTLLEVLGEGGMGTVYRADQSQPVKRQVALKLIKTGMDSRLVLARFDAERQALALMDHPNIARVYDGGATEANQPFFVMELVSGVPITDYCDRHRLTVRARLELFVAVCQAVQHAHQKGVIHRDLKPGNILVTELDGRPTPKVIDFGVAKATEFKLTDQSLADTGSIVGTPAYMSPEQADPSTMDIDTRTDIYALGVILYELLTGSPPLDLRQFRRGALLEMLRMVREVDPPRPSTKVSASDALPNIAARRDIDPAHLKRELRGDLDWIVMKALEKDRTRRYETANGMSRDVQRYLAWEAVEACPPSRTYRMRKFARRHRGALATAAAIAVSLILAAAVSLTQLVRATQAEQAARQAAVDARAERDRAVKAESRARAEAAKARAVNDFLTEDLLAQAAPENNPVGNRVTLFEVLDRAAEKVGDRFRANPESEEAVRQTIGLTYRRLAAYDKAERQWQAVLESARRRLGPDAPEVFRAQDSVAFMRQISGRSNAESLALARSATEGLTRTLGPDNPETLASRRHLGQALMSAGRLDEAIAMHEATIKAKARVLGPDHRETLMSRADLAEVYMLVGRNADAVTLLESTLKAREATVGPNHADTLTSRSYLAYAYLEAGRAADAVAVLEPVMATIETTFGPTHRVTGAASSHLARAYESTGQIERAIPLFERMLAACTAKLGPDHATTIATLVKLARACGDAGDPARAEPLWRDILARMKKTLAAAHPGVAAALAELGQNLVKQGKGTEAEPILRECLKIREKAMPDDWSTFDARSLLGGILLGQKKYDEAEPLILSAYEGMKARDAKIPAPSKRRLTESGERVVALYRAWGKPELAEAWARKLGLPLLPVDAFAPPPRP